MAIGLIGRKVGMMRLFDGGGRVRAVTVVEVEPNIVTQVRTLARDGYEAVQLGHAGNRKRVNRPERGHLRAAKAEGLSELREFGVDDIGDYQLGQRVTVADQFTPGQFVTVAAVSRGRGFAGGVRRWGFHGGPKTHGQSDRHRAPGSIGSGTTPGRVWRGQKMGGHMGARRSTVLNLLVVQVDAARNLIFVEGSVPGPKDSLVEVTSGRRKALANFAPPAPFAEPEWLAPELAISDEAVATDDVEDEALAEDAALDDDAASVEESSDEAADEATSADDAAADEKAE